MEAVSVTSSGDKKTAFLAVSSPAGRTQVQISAKEMTKLIVTLGYVRSEMTPSLPDGDLNKMTRSRWSQ